ncbi:hypothetical protein [Arthrobacter sp. KBS0703]|uniref:hypothetical protein n=1 Tax=Arthrobacter sp. KBS0703 TaxID=1955698 RepID=UPI0021B1175D|nr:hypothetical protein [Arthrobacter sp. KBS0703]
MWLSRADTTGVENLRGWLTTVVGRVCLDMLRMRRACQMCIRDSRHCRPLPPPRCGSSPAAPAAGSRG